MKELLIADRADILVVDDQADMLLQLNELLSPEFTVHPFRDGQAALGYIAAGRPVDLVILDLIMPGLDGHEVCRRLRELPDMEDVPVVFLTAQDNPEEEARGLAMGAVDFLGKPFSPPIVLNRVRNHVRLGRAMRLIFSQNDLLDRRVAERTMALAKKNSELTEALKRLAQTQDLTLVALSALAETRDNETGHHIRRTQSYVRELALTLRRRSPQLEELDDETIEALAKSASLHDIGKVAIPDAILLKPGKLDASEFETMKTHTTHGRNAIAMAETSLGDPSSFLRHAREIAYGHHERWDGRGYPQGLAGADVPLSARLMAVADVYDALICRRVYKSSFTHAQAVEEIAQSRGRQFDPDVVDAFLDAKDRFADIARAFSDGI